MKALWQYKSFRIFLAVNILLVVLLSVENMLLFSAGVLKMLRYVIFFCWVVVFGPLLFLLCVFFFGGGGVGGYRSWGSWAAPLHGQTQFGIP